MDQQTTSWHLPWQDRPKTAKGEVAGRNRWVDLWSLGLQRCVHYKYRVDPREKELTLKTCMEKRNLVNPKVEKKESMMIQTV